MQATSNHGGVQPQDQQDDGDMRAQFVQTLLSRRSEAIAGRAGSGIEEEWTEDEALMTRTGRIRTRISFSVAARLP